MKVNVSQMEQYSQLGHLMNNTVATPTENNLIKFDDSS